MSDYDSKIYPQLPENIKSGESFRLSKSCNVIQHLEKEGKHYERVRKKYSRIRNILSNISVVSGSLSIILSMSGLGTSLSGLGIVIGLPIGAIGGICGLISVVSTSYTKKLGKKISKHEQTVAIARAKINTIKYLISKALADEKMTPDEFSLILKEVDKFEEMKLGLRREYKAIDNDFLEKKQQLRNSLRTEIQKELIEKLTPSAPPED